MKHMISSQFMCINRTRRLVFSRYSVLWIVYIAVSLLLLRSHPHSRRQRNVQSYCFVRVVVGHSALRCDDRRSSLFVASQSAKRAYRISDMPTASRRSGNFSKRERKLVCFPSNLSCWFRRRLIIPLIRLARSNYSLPLSSSEFLFTWRCHPEWQLRPFHSCLIRWTQLSSWTENSWI